MFEKDLQLLTSLTEDKLKSSDLNILIVFIENVYNQKKATIPRISFM